MSCEFFQVPVCGGGDAELLNRCLRGGRIASVRKEFVQHEGRAYWAFCVETVDGPPQPGGQSGASKSPRVDYKEVLSEQDFVVFSRLRDVRKSLAERDAVPAYSIATNEQLAEMVTGKARTVADLGGIRGFGEARIGKFGAPFLSILTAETGA